MYIDLNCMYFFFNSNKSVDCVLLQHLFDLYQYVIIISDIKLCQLITDHIYVLCVLYKGH